MATLFRRWPKGENGKFRRKERTGRSGLAAGMRQAAKPCEQRCETPRVLLRHGREFQSQSLTRRNMPHERLGPDLAFRDEKIELGFHAYRLCKRGSNEQTSGAQVLDAGDIILTMTTPADPYPVGRLDARGVPPRIRRCLRGGGHGSTSKPCMAVGVVMKTYRKLQGVWKPTPENCGKQVKFLQNLPSPNGMGARAKKNSSFNGRAMNEERFGGRSFISELKLRPTKRMGRRPGSRGSRGGPLGAGLGETLVFAAGFLRRQYPESIDAQRGPERKAQQR